METKWEVESFKPDTKRYGPIRIFADGKEVATVPQHSCEGILRWTVSQAEATQRANRIALAVNSHDELTAALQAILAADEIEPRTWPALCGASIAYSDAFSLARRALNRATGKGEQS